MPFDLGFEFSGKVVPEFVESFDELLHDEINSKRTAGSAHWVVNVKTLLSILFCTLTSFQDAVAHLFTGLDTHHKALAGHEGRKAGSFLVN